ncbi:TPA: DMT family transporter [Candidatus Woesearchaeota archaeon]|nr:DMT family transporter [Candidatus Woesearchaeota archaeon]
MNWIIAAVIGYALFSGTNIIDKLFLSRYKTTPLAYYVFAVTPSMLFIPAAIILGLKIPWPLLFIIMGLGVVFIISILLYLKAMQLDDASNIMAVWQLSPVFVLILSHILLGESLTLWSYIGFFLLLLAGFFLSIEHTQGIRIKKAALLVLAACSLSAVYAVAVKYISGTLTPVEILVWSRLATFMATTVIFFTMPKIRREVYDIAKRSYYPYVLIMTLFILGNAGFFLWTYSVAKGSVSIASVLGATQPVFVFILALLLSRFVQELKEDYGRAVLIKKALALLFIIAGLVALNWQV